MKFFLPQFHEVTNLHKNFWLNWTKFILYLILCLINSLINQAINLNDLVFGLTLELIVDFGSLTLDDAWHVTLLFELCLTYN
jgi:hypothetical protein